MFNKGEGRGIWCESIVAFKITCTATQLCSFWSNHTLPYLTYLVISCAFLLLPLIHFHLYLLLHSVSLRNVGDLAGQLSRSYLPSLHDDDDVDVDDVGTNGDKKGVRKTYGNGRFTFPQHYAIDGHHSAIGNYDDENNDDNDDDEDAGGDSDCHGILSLIATQIFEQKQKEKEKAAQNSFLAGIEEDRREKEKEKERIQALAVSEMEEELRAEVEYEQEQERERERKARNDVLSAYSRGKERSGEQGIEVDVGEEGEGEGEGEEESPQHFWDSLLRKPLFTTASDSRSRSRVLTEDSSDSLKRSIGM